MRGARSNNPYNVVRLSYNDFIDLKDVQKTSYNSMDKLSNGEKINWLKIRAVKFEKETLDNMQISYDYSDSDFLVI